ncbi:MAG: amidase [Gaiellaceae bacterium]
MTAGAQELLGRLALRELSAREAVEWHVRRIEDVNPRLNAVVVPLFDEALRAADGADRARARGEKLGPLHGLPVTVKETFHVAGTPATAGVGALAGRAPAGDAPLVARLREAGAIVLGKTNLAQLIWFNEADNPIYGRTNNPWNVERAPGGSSGGEGAIVAAGGSPLGLGTDSGGSVRFPAHCCGVHALKPTSGRLPAEGTTDELILAGQSTVQNSAGLLARSVDDLRLVLDVLAGPVEPAPIAGLAVGVCEDDGVFTPSPAVGRAVREAAAALAERGAEVRAFTPPDVAEAIELFETLFRADGGAHLRELLGESERDPRIERTIAGMSVSEVSLGAVAAYQARFAAALAASGIDALVCPPLGFPAPRHGTSVELRPGQSYGALFNLLGMPAGTVAASRVQPSEEGLREVDRASAGLPVGVQVTAPHGREDVVLGVMSALEDAFRELNGYPALF